MSTTVTTAPAAAVARPQAGRTTITAVVVATVALGLLAIFGANLAKSGLDMAMSMGMTHYMELLSIRQPWNLLLFMAVPVVLAETLAITELAILFQGASTPSWVRTLSRVAGLAAGPIMVGIFLHLLLNAVLPLTLSGGWRGPADIIAVLAYLAGAAPMVGITLVELGLVGDDARDAARRHATYIAVFLVVAHIAMIFGMLDPAVLGYAMVHHH